MSDYESSGENVLCSGCGREFDSERAKNIHRGRGCNKPFHDAEELKRLYHGEGLSAAQIANRFGVTEVTIYNYLRDHGIALKNPKNDPTHPPHHRFQEHPDRPVGNCYETVSTTIDGEIYSVRIHRLIAVACDELDPEDFWNPDIVVHHDSGHGLDNRHDNLMAMSKGQHRSRHAAQ